MRFTPQQCSSTRGFTLIELLITMSVAGILMAIALPNLRTFLVSNNLSSNVNAFVGLMNYARSEAIVRNQSVLVCPKTSAASNSCNSSQFWNEYDLEVFVDVDGSDSWTTGDILLKTVTAIDTTSNNFRIVKPTGAASFIKFGAVGLSQYTHRFDLYAVNASDSAYETKYGRTVCISKPGRAKVVSYTGSGCSVF